MQTSCGSSMAASAGQFAWMSETTRIRMTDDPGGGGRGGTRRGQGKGTHPRGQSPRTASGPEPAVVPELEHQQGPEGLAVVAGPRAMLADAPGDLVGPEEALALEPLAAQERVEQGPQGAPQPARHRDAEPL